MRCRLQAQTSVWWSGVSKQIADLVKRCPECTRDATPNKEPLMHTSLPDHPWKKVGKSTTSQSIITSMKSIFSRHGIPISDNGPQYSSHECAATYNFAHVTSSPHYPQVMDGYAERAVNTVSLDIRMGGVHV